MDVVVRADVNRRTVIIKYLDGAEKLSSPSDSPTARTRATTTRARNHGMHGDHGGLSGSCLQQTFDLQGFGKEPESGRQRGPFRLGDRSSIGAWS